MTFRSEWIVKIAAVLAVLLLGAAPGLAQDGQNAYKIHVDGLSCPFCDFGIDKKLGEIKGVESIDIDLVEGAVIITMLPGKVLTETVARQAVEKAGFTPRDFQPVPPAQQAPAHG